MLVKDCMTRHPIMLPPTATLMSIQQIMAENNIRHIPIVGDGKRLEGLITRQRLNIKPDTLGSLEMWEISQYISSLTARQAMLKRREIYTINSDRAIERAARTMIDSRVGCLPVVEDGDIVVGILTETDLLNSYQEMLGLPAPGIRVTIRMPDRPGEFAKLMQVMADQQWGVMGIGTFPSHRQPGFYDVVIKIPRIESEDVQRIIGQIPDQEIVDIRASV